MILFFMRAFVWVMIHVLYRVRVKGLENMPTTGAFVIVCNHVSFVDALIIMAAVKRPVRFVMDHRIFKAPLIGLLFRAARTIPIAPKRENEALMEKAFAEVKKALDNGEVIGIFPEGKITNDGNINEFRPGIERVIRASSVPVCPMALQGLWGSFFSRVEGHAMRHPFRRGMFSRVELVAGPMVPHEIVSAKLLQDRVSDLHGGLP